jgi:hypothetical protein
LLVIDHVIVRFEWSRFGRPAARSSSADERSGSLIADCVNTRLAAALAGEAMPEHPSDDPQRRLRELKEE